MSKNKIGEWVLHVRHLDRGYGQVTDINTTNGLTHIEWASGRSSNAAPPSVATSLAQANDMRMLLELPLFQPTGEEWNDHIAAGRYKISDARAAMGYPRATPGFDYGGAVVSPALQVASFPEAVAAISEVLGTTANDPALLTPEELHVINLTAQLWDALVGILGDGATRDADAAELAGPIHTIQNAVLAQAAARAYPQFRLLGGNPKPRFSVENTHRTRLGGN